MTTTKKKITKRTIKRTFKHKRQSSNRVIKIHDKNLSLIYVCILIIGLLIAFPYIVDWLIFIITITVFAGLGLVGYVVINRSIDYRQRSLPERMIGALPIEAYKYRSTAKVLGSSNQTWKLSEPKLIETNSEEDIIDIEPIVIRDYSFDEAYKQSDKYNWNIGQIDGTDQLATFNFTKQSHVLVCGGTNCGKTSTTGFMLALYALKSKFHVIVFDGAGGSDWNEFKPYTEHYEALPEHLELIISNIERLYAERQDKLKELNVADNYSMDKPLQPIVIIIDELGYLLDGLKAEDKNKYKEIVLRFKKMIRVIRKTSIHLVLIDQNANSIPQDILTNIKCIFAYNAEGYIGSTIKRFNLDKLKPQGQFDYGHKIVNGWYTKKFLPQYLPTMKPIKQVLMLSDEELKIEDKIVLKDEESIVVSKNEDRGIDKSNAGIAGPLHTIQYNTNPTTKVNSSSKSLPKSVASRLEFVTQLIEIGKSEELNDSKVRKYCKQITGKSLDGNASKQILEYITQRQQNNASD